jgi:hypothetical protein
VRFASVAELRSEIDRGMFARPADERDGTVIVLDHRERVRAIA